MNKYIDNNANAWYNTTMSTKTKTVENRHEQIKKIDVIDESKPDRLFVYPETKEAAESIKRTTDEFHKYAVQARRDRKYLPKAIDIITGSLPSDNEIASRKSEDAWKRQGKK
jgi:hypothetical protein